MDQQFGRGTWGQLVSAPRCLGPQLEVPKSGGWGQLKACVRAHVWRLMLAVGWGTSGLLPRASLCELSSCSDLGFLAARWLRAQSGLPRKREAGGSWIFFMTWTRESHGVVSSIIYWLRQSPAPPSFRRKECRPYLLVGRESVTIRQRRGRNIYIFVATFGKSIFHTGSFSCSPGGLCREGAISAPPTSVQLCGD